MKRRRFMVNAARFVPAAMIIAVSWYLSSQSRVEMPDFSNSDKAVHLVCFAGLAFWMSFGMHITEARMLWKIGVPSLATSVYGMIDEFHQHFTPGRNVSFFDWLSDTIGALLGSFAYVLFLLLLAFIVEKRRGCRKM